MDAMPDDPPTRSAGQGFSPPEARRFALIAAILASSMGFIDGSVVALAMPAIRADLAASLTDAQWISNAYLLPLSALVLIGGAAGDVVGVRNIFGIGIALFMVTSLACAVATDADMLIAMRAAQGVGAALMVPGSLALIAKTYPASTRGWAIAQWSAFSSVTTAFGPFIGGMVLSFGDPWMWRVIFAINVPVGLVALAMLWLKVPQDRPSEARRLDIGGAVLATIGLGLIAWGLTEYGLADAERVLDPTLSVIAGVAVSVLFVVWEWRARSPMVKLELFRSKAFSGANVYTLILFFALTAVLFFLPMTLVSAWGKPEWQASLVMLPLSVAIATLSGRAARWSDAVGPRTPLTIGALLMTVSYAGVALTMPAMAMWSVTLPILALHAVGMALLVSPLSAAVMLATPDTDTGLASGVNHAVARAAGLLAVAGLGALAALIFAAQGAGALPGVEYGAVVEPPLDAAAEAIRVGAANRAFAAVAGVAALMCLISAAIAWFTQPSWERGRGPVRD